MCGKNEELNKKELINLKTYQKNNELFNIC